MVKYAFLNNQSPHETIEKKQRPIKNSQYRKELHHARRGLGADQLW